MSVYCFGKYVVKQGCVYQHKDNHLSLEIDPDDASLLDELMGLESDAGVYFSIRDEIGAPDATKLWLEAMKEPHFIESSLGKAIYSIVFDQAIEGGGLAMVDGSIEKVLSGSPADCWDWISDRVKLPWDATDNPLVIWKRDETEGVLEGRKACNP